MKEEKALSKLKVKDYGLIKKITAEGSLKKKLIDMGVIPNSSFEIVKVAPFKGPMDLKIRGYHLSLRRSEADFVLVEVDKDD